MQKLKTLPSIEAEASGATCALFSMLLLSQCPRRPRPLDKCARLYALNDALCTAQREQESGRLLPKDSLTLFRHRAY